MRVAGGIDGVEAVFDEGSLVADAGLLLAGTLAARLGLEALIDTAGGEMSRAASAGLLGVTTGDIAAGCPSR